ncbi:glucose PTS transporter subunit EIIB [Kitasatospora sp. NPDC101176]|uniref:glucose PTS transporter subunit EIIB n=1 Tax=Kitasatospora sp. NPDC101176 TaxID=3364099 RepID=UPI003823905E
MAKIEADDIVEALGGLDNIEEAEGCITRIRVSVLDSDLVCAKKLKSLGAFGVVQMGTAIQVVVGPTADIVAGEIQDRIDANE